MAKGTQKTDRIYNRMDNPVDQTLIDLGLVNFVQHPTNKNYIVYRFADKTKAEAFENELTKNKIWFEKSISKKRSRDFFLFGVHKNDYKKTQQINFDVEAKHKKPFIPFRFLRWFLLIFSAIVMTITILGYCNQQKKLQQVNMNLIEKSETTNK